MCVYKVEIKNIIGSNTCLVSCPAPVMYTRERVWSKGLTSLSSSYIYCSPIGLQNRDHMTLVECSYVRSVSMYARALSLCTRYGSGS